MGRTLIFDLETNGLLPEVSKVHTLCIYDTATLKFTRFDKEKVPAGLIELADADTIIGHNILDYDIPVIQKLYPTLHITKPRALDTMVWGRLAWPDIKSTDFGLVKKGVLPGKLIGSHSLKAYGYRLMELKGDYAETTDWSKWTPELSDYCEQDVRVTARLYEKLCSRKIDRRAIELEHAVQQVIIRQMRHGVLFDVKGAEALYATLLEQQRELGDKLRSLFPPWYVRKGTFTPKRDNKKMGYAAGGSMTKVEYTEFNPASRPHIASRLKWKYGWVPEDFTNTGQPELDDEVLKALPYPEAQQLAEYLLLQKRLGQIAEGNQAWLKCYDQKSHRINGYVNSNGAVTGRMTHSAPNMAQVPRVGTIHGSECRALFCAPAGKKLVGIDASGLELRCLAHYLAKYDGGEYVQAVLSGDIHSFNQKALGIESRNDAKTFIYAWLYGAGEEKLGSILGQGAGAGRALKNKFFKALPAVKQLKHDVEVAARRGYLVGLDGRHIPVRSLHSALNTLLQGAGAIIMKKALVILDEKLRQEAAPGKEYEFVLNVHDEFQIEANEEIAEAVGREAVKAIQLAGESFGLRCPLDGEYKCGSNWADTH